jgi:hypothetical protein
VFGQVCSGVQIPAPFAPGSLQPSYLYKSKTKHPVQGWILTLTTDRCVTYGDCASLQILRRAAANLRFLQTGPAEADDAAYFDTT